MRCHTRPAPAPTLCAPSTSTRRLLVSSHGTIARRPRRDHAQPVEFADPDDLALPRALDGRRVLIERH
ncbi:hypothetical protein AB0L49_27890 [Streptomyces antimycoticus]|uniref:hypothetical protein n=1 Tax=Streptomyces antimycoticus TaxID=68175 RepID=UPI00342712C7